MAAGQAMTGAVKLDEKWGIPPARAITWRMPWPHGKR